MGHFMSRSSVIDLTTDNLTNNKRLFNCDNRHGSKRTNDITSLHSQQHYGLTNRRPITQAGSQGFFNEEVRSNEKTDHNKTLGASLKGGRGGEKLGCLKLYSERFEGGIVRTQAAKTDIWIFR